MLMLLQYVCDYSSGVGEEGSMSEQNETAAAAGALGGRTARACDSCMRRRARWFCAADDAFLCQACDAAVHSANSLARRHHRLRLNTSSSPSSSSLSAYNINTVSLSDLLKPNTDNNNNRSDDQIAVKDADHEPKWYHGFMRKARTPRPKPRGGGRSQHIPLTAKSTESLVPDLEATALAYDIEEGGEEEEQHELLYRVPIFDPVLAEFCSPPRPLLDNMAKSEAAQQQFDNDLSPAMNSDEAGLAKFLPSEQELVEFAEQELVEFAADMETLLGRGVDDSGGAFCIDDLDDGRVKTEASMEHCTPMELIVEGRLDDEERKTPPPVMSYDGEEEEGHRRRILRLDYDAVIEAWSTSGSTSPWTDGERPQMNPNECLPGFMGMSEGGEQVYFETAAALRDGGGKVAGDSGREARVSRYREKRRSRLFSKKIRYEVRKLNAEKRPRMKGRFVKRSTAAVQPSPAAAAGFAY